MDVNRTYPMDVNRMHLRNALRRLSLPVVADQEGEALDAADAELQALGVAPEDRAAWIDLEWARWRLEGSASVGLQRVIRAGLRAGDSDDLDGRSRRPDIGDRLASKYFQLHKALAVHPLFDHDHASILLSHARLAALLAHDEQLSASMVASVLRARDGRTPIGWKVVESILSALAPGRAMTVEMVDQVMKADEDAASEEFGDANWRECTELLAEAGKRVHLGCDLGHEALALLPLEEGDPAWPSGAHLVMLYYCAAQVEYWDHKVSSIYEFSPRGKAAGEVTRRFRDAGVYAATENPFLNNAKSAPSVDREWAWTKGPGEAASAHALANVLAGLDELAFAPRRHLARLIRAWLMRILQFCRPQNDRVYLPDTVDERSAWALAERIAAGPTSTRGVLEQRFMDAIGIVLYTREGKEPVARGIGDSVNSNNLSRRKLGDVEFQVGPYELVAFEPHGGALRQVYVDSHELSLKQVASERLRAWDDTGSTRGDWTLTVYFVAFTVEGVKLPASIVLPDPSSASAGASRLSVRYEAKTYEQFLAECAGKPLAQSFTTHFLRPLSAPYVPIDVRRKLSGWIT